MTGNAGQMREPGPGCTGGSAQNLGGVEYP